MILPMPTPRQREVMTLLGIQLAPYERHLPGVLRCMRRSSKGFLQLFEISTSGIITRGYRHLSSREQHCLHELAFSWGQEDAKDA